MTEGPEGTERAKGVEGVEGAGEVRKAGVRGYTAAGRLTCFECVVGTWPRMVIRRTRQHIAQTHTHMCRR